MIIWLAPRAGKITQIARCDWLPERATRKKNFPESHIINPLFTKFVRSRWLHIVLVLFCAFIDLDFVSVHQHTKKELGQYPAILTSHSVNNPYVLSLFDGSYVLEHRRLDGVVNRSFLLLCCIKTNRFLFTVRLFSNSSQKKSIKNFSDTLRLA